jgi:hypothetical protein
VGVVRPSHAADLGSRRRPPACARPGTGFIIAIGRFACYLTADGTNTVQVELVDLIVGEIATRSNLTIEEE